MSDNKCPFEFSIRETEEGFAIDIKGEKDMLKPKLEAIEAYLNFREKAKAAGIGNKRRERAKEKFNLMHKHFKMIHDKHFGEVDKKEDI